MTPIDPNLVVSKALTLQQGTIAAGGNRYEANLVAKYMFKTGQGSTAYDTSGVTPAADLTLSGNVTWVGGWGVNVRHGRQGAGLDQLERQDRRHDPVHGRVLARGVGRARECRADQCLHRQLLGQQHHARCDAGAGRHAVRGHGAQQHHRAPTASRRCSPPTTGGAAQAALQHVVLTYDPVNGQKLYVNGVYTGDADPAKGGSLANWDNTFALVLGNETTGQRPVAGVVKFAAIHNRALTRRRSSRTSPPASARSTSCCSTSAQLSGVPQSYILFQASQYDNYSYLFDAAEVHQPRPAARLRRATW